MANREFDAASFNDPVATKTEWKAVNESGGNFKTHNLVEHGSSRAEFRLTGFARFFAGAFPALGVAALIAGLATLSILELWMSAVLFGAGLLFTGAGVWLWKRMTRPILFDKGAGTFGLGVEIEGGKLTRRTKARVPLKSIHALQLVSFFVPQTGPDDGNYWTHELNLVLDGGARVHVLGHGDLGQLRADAERLGSFLKVPVWDASD